MLSHGQCFHLQSSVDVTLCSQAQLQLRQPCHVPKQVAYNYLWEASGKGTLGAGVLPSKPTTTASVPARVTRVVLLQAHFCNLCRERTAGCCPESCSLRHRCRAADMKLLVACVLPRGDAGRKALQRQEFAARAVAGLAGPDGDAAARTAMKPSGIVPALLQLLEQDNDKGVSVRVWASSVRVSPETRQTLVCKGSSMRDQG